MTRVQVVAANHPEVKEGRFITVFLRIAILLSCILISVQGIVFGERREAPLMDYSYRGSGKPGASGREFAKAMEHLEVQKALLEVAAAPRARAFLETALRGTGVTPESLETLRLVHREGDSYVLGFSLYTNADLDRIRDVAEVEGRSLAAAVLARRAEIQDILARNPQPGVDWRAVAFFIIGCVSLDWDGLNLVEERGYLAVPEEGSYIPNARQSGGGSPIRGLYWGSHNYHDDIAVTSFGDHAAVPRIALPDLLWPVKGALQGMEAPESVKSSLVDAADALIRRRAGMMMIALRDGEKTDQELAAAAGLTEAETSKLLDLLVQLNYIIAKDNRCRALIPVLNERDLGMVKQLRRIGHDVMAKWLDDHHKVLSEELKDLTPVRYGVPLSEGFYWVWHYVFGTANRELVAAGLFADPYAPDRTYKGFIPAVYPLDVAQGPM